jgi:segregation and condensation protein B
MDMPESEGIASTLGNGAGPAGNGESHDYVADGVEHAVVDRHAAPAADELMAIVEALLFASPEPVPVARFLQVLDGIERREVLRALQALRGRLDAEARGIHLVEVGGGWQLRTRQEHAPWVRRLLGGRPPRLSRAMLETLAIVAYRQPCTRPEIEAIRGVDVGAVMATLVERRLVRLLGRKEAPGRPILYGTTSEFLEVFGLPDLAALPPLAELGEVPAVLAGTDLAVTPHGVVPATDADDATVGEGDDDDGTDGCATPG